MHTDKQEKMEAKNLFYFSSVKKNYAGNSYSLTSSVTFGSAPAFNKQFMISKLPLSAAMCKGVTPPTLILTLAPAYTLENAKVRIAEKNSYEVAQIKLLGPF